MLQQLLTILIGILGGVSVGIQTPIANYIGQRAGGVTSSFIIHVSGAFMSGLLLIARGGENIAEVRNLPWWVFGSGIFGVVLYLTISHTIPRIGATAGVMLIIVGQLTVSMLIDQFGLFGVAYRPIDATRLVAVGCLLLGSFLMVK